MSPYTQQLHELENKIEQFTYETGEKIGSFASAVTNTTENYVDTTENYVKEHPIQALAMAATAGLVIGGLLAFLLSRKD